ncbi:VOC family protein [Nonomuraea sp. SBT364]|uniref:VOC family protein n=1 Tax=Nonomuraea sp. SBT364 TaxID=1580530 RepID=UPI00066DC930|nr:VOC family protein [Nonomuraea sp. SBT364]
MIDPRLDHLLYAVPDLTAAVAEFGRRTGVTPVAGGSHPGGTANYLVGLGPAAYLEIIGPDPAADPATRRRAAELELLDVPRLAGWAVHPDDIGKAVREARDQGYDPGDVEPMSRRTPDGRLLEWRLTRWDEPARVDPVPFLIDWGATPHPASSGLPQVSLVAFGATHPDPPELLAWLGALRVELDVQAGAAVALRAVLESPLGRVELT